MLFLFVNNQFITDFEELNPSSIFFINYKLYSDTLKDLSKLLLKFKYELGIIISILKPTFVSHFTPDHYFFSFLYK